MVLAALQAADMEIIESPCVRICVLDSVTDHCIGCGRTRAEIAGWRQMSPPARRAIMERLPERLRTMTRRDTRAERPRRRSTTSIPPETDSV
jgi:hypothetical protein